MTANTQATPRDIDFSRPPTIAERITGEAMTAEEYAAAEQEWRRENGLTDDVPLSAVEKYTSLFRERVMWRQADREARDYVESTHAKPDQTFEPTDLSGLLTGEVETPPPPDVLAFRSGVGLFYRGKTNELYGDPEGGKTWIALAAAVEVIARGGCAHYIDMDHNGAATIAEHLMILGAKLEDIADSRRFSFWEPQTPDQVNAVVERVVSTAPDLVVLDSIGELLPLYGASSNSADDYTAVHTTVLKPMAVAGACVLSIDHPSKGAESRAYGPTGTMAKRRVVRGTSIFVELDGGPYAPGSGGRSRLTINKDAGGHLRALATDKKHLGSFVLHADGGWSFGDAEPKPAQAAVKRRAGLWEWIYDQLSIEPMSGSGLIAELDKAYPGKRPTGWGNSNVRLVLAKHTGAEDSDLIHKGGKYHVRE